MMEASLGEALVTIEYLPGMASFHESRKGAFTTVAICAEWRYLDGSLVRGRQRRRRVR